MMTNASPLHAVPVYSVFNNLEIVEDHEADERVTVLDEKTGKWVRKSFFISSKNALSPEFKPGAEYGYGRCLDYSLSIGCDGRDWHDVLAKMVGFDSTGDAEPDEAIPFRELLHPARNNATFGPKVAKKLFGEFAAWEERAKTFADPEFYLAYWWLSRCFGHAANDGAVQIEWVGTEKV